MRHKLLRASPRQSFSLRMSESSASAPSLGAAVFGPYFASSVLQAWDSPDGSTTLELSAYAPANEAQLPGLMALVAPALSEPYSIFTYRYFLQGWPQLCFLAHARPRDAPGGGGGGGGGDLRSARLVGAVVCKEEVEGAGTAAGARRCGYVAMLVVDPAFRKQGVGLRLAERAVAAMSATCDEIVLETEVANAGALRLYEGLGFLREKRLPRYYLSGSDAFRLKCAWPGALTREVKKGGKPRRACHQAALF